MLEKIKQIANRAEQFKDKLINEEVTKTSLILPFVSALGYDVTNPFEVVPEFYADYPDLKGDKVDLCVMINEEPTIMIECKKYEADLDKSHKRQLAKYFHWIKSVRITILTNGREFEFYSDLKAPNVMDDVPFFRFTLDSINENDALLLEQFTKSKFNIDEVIEQASKSSASGIIYEFIKNNFDNPDDEYMTFLLKQVIDKLPSTTQVVTQKVKDTFKPAVIDAHKKLINTIISDRLQAVIKIEKNDNDIILENEVNNDGVVTTDEEIQGYNIVKAILSESLDPERIYIRDSQTYCAVILDDNNRKPIVRMWFNSQNNKYIEIFKIKSSPIKQKIEKVNDIFKFKIEIKEAIVQYITNNNTEV